jgi:hypothetical protein
MATKLTKTGYGQLELNQVAFRRSGRIEAQCALNPVDFEKVSAENGMLLAVDNTSRTIKFPVEGSDLPIALNYTTEHMYDERERGLKYFKLDKDTFLPRIGFVGIGDKWTTNTIAYDTDEFADEAALKEALKGQTKLYGVPCELGYHKITATKGDGFAVEVIKADTMPDGQFAVQFGGLQ